MHILFFLPLGLLQNCASLKLKVLLVANNQRQNSVSQKGEKQQQQQQPNKNIPACNYKRACDEGISKVAKENGERMNVRPNQTTADQFTRGSNDGWLNHIGLMNLGSH